MWGDVFIKAKTLLFEIVKSISAMGTLMSKFYKKVVK
jgi:hypothetical protein